MAAKKQVDTAVAKSQKVDQAKGSLKGLDAIEVVGARVHNLKNVSVAFPRGKFIVVTGVSGSGKSTLLASLINDDKKRFYTGKFDKMFLFSPTAEGDDIQKQYGIDKKYVFTNLSDAHMFIKTIHETQKKKIKES
jgi:excinuclease UvrABC ATPase subunit